MRRLALAITLSLVVGCADPAPLPLRPVIEPPRPRPEPVEPAYHQGSAPSGCELAPIEVVAEGGIVAGPDAPVNRVEPVFSGDFGFFPIVGDAPQPVEEVVEGALRLELHGASQYAVGEPLGLELTFVGDSRRVTIVGRARDGSFPHWVSPYYDLLLRDRATGRTYRWAHHGGRCGNLDGMREDDRVTLLPGTRLADVPGRWASYLQDATISAPGDYEAWVVYRACPGDREGFVVLAHPDPDGASLTPGVLVSNAVALEVRLPSTGE